MPSAGNLADAEGWDHCECALATLLPPSGLGGLPQRGHGWAQPARHFTPEVIFTSEEATPLGSQGVGMRTAEPPQHFS